MIELWNQYKVADLEIKRLLAERKLLILQAIKDDPSLSVLWPDYFSDYVKENEEKLADAHTVSNLIEDQIVEVIGDNVYLISDTTCIFSTESGIEERNVRKASI